MLQISRAGSPRWAVCRAAPLPTEVPLPETLGDLSPLLLSLAQDYQDLPWSLGP